MSKYVSWTNVFSVWAIGCLQFSLWLGNYGEGRRMMVAALMAFLVAYTVSDIISRYQALKGKKD